MDWHSLRALSILQILGGAQGTFRTLPYPPSAAIARPSSPDVLAIARVQLSEARRAVGSGQYARVRVVEEAESVLVREDGSEAYVDKLGGKAPCR